MRLLNRREFSGFCVAFGSFTAASALDLASSTASATAGRTVKFRNGTVVPALGHCSAGLGKGKRPQVDEEEAVRTGLSPGAKLLRDPTLARIGAAHGCSAAAVALAWAIRPGKIIAIPESGSVAHVKENAVALSLTLTPQDIQALRRPSARSRSFMAACKWNVR